MKKIILTGGGTAGHVTPCIALIPKLRSEGYIIEYIGSKSGMEKELIEKMKVSYHSISTGKLRRYLDFKNLTDAFKVVKGIGDSLSVLKKTRPDVIFSKGGFVGVPVVIAGRILGTPVIIHESDFSCGLANRISIPFANAVCVSFPETLDYVPKSKAVLTGTPIRKALFSGVREIGLSLCRFDSSKPVVLIIGGSLGSVKINSVIREALPKMLHCFQVAHICGKGNMDNSINLKGYRQFEYVGDELPHLFAMANVIVSRAGANSISEILALCKPAILIPLSKNASRGDQILNAESFARQGFSKVLYEDEMTEATLMTEIIDMNANSERYIAKMKESSQSDSVKEVMKIIKKYAKG